VFRSNTSTEEGTGFVKSLLKWTVFGLSLIFQKLTYSKIYRCLLTEYPQKLYIILLQYLLLF
jgi:hypothetical protein